MALDPENPSSIYACARRRARTRARCAARSPPRCGRCSTRPGSRCSRWTRTKMEARGISAFFDWVKERSHLFRGVTFGTMHRDDAYEFARLGTHIERADSTARILDVKYHVLLPSVKDVGGAVDYYQWSAVLRSVSAFEAYRKVYRDVITPLKLAELLILRDDMPQEPALLPAPGVRHARARAERAVRRDAAPRRPDPLAACSTAASRRSSPAGLHEYLTDFLDSTQELVDRRSSAASSPSTPWSSRRSHHDLLRRPPPRHRHDLRLGLAHQRGRGPHRHVHARCASTRRRTTA